MYDLSVLQCKILKQIKKSPNGISTEELVTKNDNDDSIKYILSELQNEDCVSRLISSDDKIRKAFGLESGNYTGNWIITDKGLACLKNNKLELKLKIINRLVGFIFGVATTFLGQFFIRLIFR